MSAFEPQTVLDVRHWTDTLFSFTTTRSASFRFNSGQFTMVGLQMGPAPLARAYSLAGAHYDDMLEFFSIKVQDGPLTSKLQHLRQGDVVLVGRKATGTLVLHHLLPGRRLCLFATGTGLAPFASLIRDPEVYERFEHVVLVHGCRRRAELAYGECVVDAVRDSEFLGPLARAQLVYHPTVTREPFRNQGRLTDLMASGRLWRDLGQAPLDAESDRVMLCGGPAMLRETQDMLEGAGFVEGSGNKPGGYVVEKAFVEK
ncbi:MAG TPA: ferredoxin--NADP reductase [Acetobacteraceae bacterium]|jgi:ferredoxin--NADP+ reductase